MMNNQRFGYLGSMFNIAFSATSSLFHNYFLSLLFIVLASLSFIFAIYSKNKLKQEIDLSEFKFIDPPGHFTHPSYSFPICPRCLNKTKSISPVSNGYCTFCKEPISETLKSGGDMFTVPDK